jgi:chromosome segregation ATPase
VDSAKKDAQRDVEKARKNAEADVEKARKAAEAEAEKARKAAEAEADKARKALEGERDEAKSQAETTREELESTKRKLADVESARDERQKKVDALEGDVSKGKADLEARGAELEASRKALEALRTAEAATVRDRRPQLRKGSDLDKALAALGAPDSVRERIARAVRDEVDLAVLGRGGPVVPVRGLRCVACDADLESELRKIAASRKWDDEARGLGLADLPREQVEAAIERARKSPAGAGR